MTFAVRYLLAVVFMFTAIHSTAAPAAEVCDENDVLVTTTPAPPANADRWRMYRRELALANHVNVDVILLGDSLAELWNTSTWEPKRVLDLGLGGDDTQRVLWRLSSPKLARLKPRHVLIILGTNNLGFDKACAISEGLKRVIRRTAKLWPSTQIAFLEIPPKGAHFAYKNDDRTKVNTSIRLLKGVKTINVDDAITCSWKEPCANYRDDNVHFTEAGYRIVLQAVRPALFGR